MDQPDRRLEPRVVDAAYAYLPALLPAPDGATPPASWVVHRGADTGAYLLAYSWFFDNVVECRIAIAGQPALDCPDDDPAHFVDLTRPGVGCVWELGVLEHERIAWIRHVLAPDRPTSRATWRTPGRRGRWAADGRLRVRRCQRGALVLRRRRQLRRDALPEPGLLRLLGAHPEPGDRAVVDLLDAQRAGRAGAAAGGGPVHRRRR
ncbi:hypothetical protein V2I01_37105 [Micromonospora sp. BRA006-A]|nr:hypothetical protein [Micromonospora sp. BRA006-A]